MYEVREIFGKLPYFNNPMYNKFFPEFELVNPNTLRSGDRRFIVNIEDKQKIYKLYRVAGFSGGITYRVYESRNFLDLTKKMRKLRHELF